VFPPRRLLFASIDGFVRRATSLRDEVSSNAIANKRIARKGPGASVALGGFLENRCETLVNVSHRISMKLGKTTGGCSGSLHSTKLVSTNFVSLPSS